MIKKVNFQSPRRWERIFCFENVFENELGPEVQFNAIGGFEVFILSTQCIDVARVVN